MKRLSANDLRRTYLDYFVRHGHTEVPSASLVPAGDPTLLFTNAGMVPFKDAFLGLESRPYKRATTAQKALRVSGKHNDLEEVGPSPRHHTFFEMLGNFSFGDYFKAEAISLAWQLLTVELAVPVERLWFTVFAGNKNIPADEEAERLWVAAGAAPERVLRFGEKDNFWSMGDTGPCGPNSEITMFIGDDISHMRADGVNSDDPDYVEVWNLVFMQFDRVSLKPLPFPSVDTGMGLERMAMVLQGGRSTYDTDLFRPIIERTLALTGGDMRDYHAQQAAYRAIADHTRACAFLIADGIVPGNEGRSYVLRRILRRAAYLGRTLGLTRPFLAETASVVVATMGDAYPELPRKRAFILEALTMEEERFNRTLTGGIGLLDSALLAVPTGGQLSGRDAFTLYDTHGFPLDLTQKIVAERGYSVDEAGFDSAMSAQKMRSRQATLFARGAAGGQWTGSESLLTALPPTTFTGYAALNDADTRVLALLVDGHSVDRVTDGDTVHVVLDRTPLYAESGGQVGDTGTLRCATGHIRVIDTQRPLPTLIVHAGVVENGYIDVGTPVQADVDAQRRADVARNHTATHLLHRALREVLGEHAAQRGSLVAPDRMRFDFSHAHAIPSDTLRAIESRVNAWIRADSPVQWAIMSQQEALDAGAIALFGEKYGDRVRMVTIGCGFPSGGDSATVCSRELCGGTHVGRTGEIGYFRILSEGSVSSGVRRIEVVTGRAAVEWADAQASALRDIAAQLAVPTSAAVDRLDTVLSELKRQQREIEGLREKASLAMLATLVEQARTVHGITVLTAVVEAEEPARLRDMGDWLRDRLRSAVIVLGARMGDKPQFLVVVTADLVARGYHAGKLVGALAALVGGRGGGRADMAQGGGTESSHLDQAMNQVEELVIGQGRQ